MKKAIILQTLVTLFFLGGLYFPFKGLTTATWWQPLEMIAICFVSFTAVILFYAAMGDLTGKSNARAYLIIYAAIGNTAVNLASLLISILNNPSPELLPIGMLHVMFISLVIIPAYFVYDEHVETSGIPMRKQLIPSAIQLLLITAIAIGFSIF